MIRYALKCSNDHRFESWFQSAVAYERLETSGYLACAICGDQAVAKDLMAPALRPVRKAAGHGDGAPAAGPSLALPNSDIEKAIAELRQKVEENADYVGTDFATLARAIHEGDAPERAIWGEARPEDARALMEDGVPVAPLPFLPTRKAN